MAIDRSSPQISIGLFYSQWLAKVCWLERVCAEVCPCGGKRFLLSNDWDNRSTLLALIDSFGGGDQLNELFVGLKAPQLFRQLLHRFHRMHGVERTSQHGNCIECLLIM